MAVKIEVVEQEFLNEFQNDVGFVSNPADVTANLAGAVMENVRIIQKVQVSWKSDAAPGNEFIVSVGGLQITRANGSFIADGLSTNDLIRVSALGNFQATVITPTQINFTAPIPLAAGPYQALTLEGVTPLTASVYKFGLIENSEQFNVVSKVSNNDQGFYGSGFGLGPLGARDNVTVVQLQRLGVYNDWITGDVSVRYDSTINNDTIQIFEIIHDLTIVPYYLDGELSNLQNDVIPTLLAGLNSLKYVFSAGFRTVLSNPNTEKTADIDISLGAVAWFNENYNGFNNNYQINSVAYEEEATGNSADGLLIGSKTKVTIDVEKTTGNFIAGERAGVYVSYLPEQSEYTDTVLTDLKENFLYDNALNNEGVVAANGQDFITNFEITNLVGNTMTLTFDVDYSIAQKVRLAGLISNNPIYFLIGVELGDATLTSANSDRILLLADTEKYDASADIPDLWSFPKMDLYTHEKQIGVDTGTTDVTSWNEDGIAIDFTMRLDLNKDALLNSMSMVLLAYDPITKIYFLIDQYNYNMFPAIVSSGVQQLIINADRGYILEGTDQFNDVSLSVGANAAGLQDYDGVIGQKFSWQDWIENLNVDTVFFDASKPQNNRNLKTSNYSLLNGYEIRMGFLGNLFGTGTLGTQGLTDYLVLTPTLTVYDYEEDGGADVWSQVVETYNEAATVNLGGAVLTGQNTLFRSTWTNSGGPVTSLVNLWGVNRIEETNQPAYAITEMSSLNAPDNNQLLIPTVGFTLLDMYLSGGDVIMECLIDGSVAQSGINYNLSTRIQDDTAGVVGGKITEAGVLKDTEGGVQKIIE